jgi:hypothetical protein
MACLKRENTIIILVKEVTINNKVGAKAINVKITAILIVFTNCAGSVTPETERLIIGAESAAKAKIENNKSVSINFKKNPIKIKYNI